MRAPNSISFLSKAYNFFKGKMPAEDETFYSKPKNSLRKPTLWAIQREPMNHEAFPCKSQKNRQVFGEISNRPWSVTNRDERKQQRTFLESCSPRSFVKNHWMGKADNNVNNVEQLAPKSENFHEQTEDDEDEGIFTIELIKPQNGLLGIVLIGGADTPLGSHYVNDVLPNSSASKSGCVRTGDELLKANGQALNNKTHAEALSIFRSLPAVVELEVARTKDANRSILERLSREKKANKKVNKNIASPEKRRSIVEEAAKTSVIPRSLSSVIDVTTRALRPNVKPVKRVCRVSSFVGREDDEVPQNVNDGNSDAQKQKQEATDEDRDNQLKENDKAEILPSSTETQDVCPGGGNATGGNTSNSSAIHSFSPCDANFNLPQISEDDTPHYLTIRRSPAFKPHIKRPTTIKQSDTRATWPAVSTKQRIPLPWDSLQPSRTATTGLSSSARIRRSMSATSASSLSLHRDASARKPTRDRYIEKKIITIELQRMSTREDWGLTLGGGICSPYGDLPIFIAEISPSVGIKGLLQKGDEIVDFSGESFQGATYLEAEKMIRRCDKKIVTVTIRRKFLRRSQRSQGNPYAEAWSSVTTTKARPVCKQRTHSKSIHCSTFSNYEGKNNDRQYKVPM